MSVWVRGCDGVDAQGVRFCLAKAKGTVGMTASKSSSSSQSSSSNKGKTKPSRDGGRHLSGAFKVRCRVSCRVAENWCEVRGRGAG